MVISNFRADMPSTDLDDSDYQQFFHGSRGVDWESQFQHKDIFQMADELQAMIFMNEMINWCLSPERASDVGIPDIETDGLSYFASVFGIGDSHELG